MVNNQKVITCLACGKKCWLDGDRECQTLWFCPNVACKAPLPGFNGERNMHVQELTHMTEYMKQQEHQHG